MKLVVSFLSILLLTVNYLFAQPGFSYQASLRNTDGTLRSNESLVLDIELIRDDSVVYSESHALNTNDYGVFSLVVGQGSTGDSYTTGKIFLNYDSTEVHETYLRVSEQGGNVLSETQILGVPIAEVAKVALKAHIDFPPGSIIAFGGRTNKIPDGWLFCGGKVVSREQYKDLFNAIGTAWGNGDGSTTFHLPDMRGVFLRGVGGDALHPNGSEYMDNGAERIALKDGGNIGNKVGSFQPDQIMKHDHHSWIKVDHGSAYTSTIGYDVFKVHSGTVDHGGVWGTIRVTYFSPEELFKNETHPRNVSINYMIKY